MAKYDDPFNDMAFVERFETRRQEHDSVNLCVDEPAILTRVDALKPSDTLEVGCATGMLTRRLLERTGNLVALDQSELMIRKALEEVVSDRVQFVCSNFLEYTPSVEFDLIVSAMTPHLVEDFDSFSASAHRLLKKGGSFVFTQRHPIRTANPDGDADSEFQPSWRVSNYFQRGLREYRWLGADVRCFHRPVEEIVSTLIKNGFSIMEIAEPMPNITDASQRIIENLNSPSVLLLHVTK